MIPRIGHWVLRVSLIAALVGVVVFLALMMYARQTGTSPYRIGVSGRVTDSGGNPIPGVRVIAEPQSGEQISPQDNLPRVAALAKVKTAGTDNKGRYEFRRLVGGVCPILSDGWFEKQLWRIVADAEGFGPQHVEVSHVPAGRVLQRNKSFRDLDFVLKEEVRVSGRAFNTRGEPLADRFLQPVLHGEPGDANGKTALPAPAKTDADGSFQFDNLFPGDYTFRTEGYPEDVYSWWHHEAEGFVVPQIAMSDPIMLEAGTSVEGIEVVFESPEDRGTIAGRVMTAETWPSGSNDTTLFVLQLARISRFSGS